MNTLYLTKLTSVLLVTLCRSWVGGQACSTRFNCYGDANITEVKTKQLPWALYISGLFFQFVLSVMYLTSTCS